jgi:hypothetical protein
MILLAIISYVGDRPRWPGAIDLFGLSLAPILPLAEKLL